MENKKRFEAKSWFISIVLAIIVFIVFIFLMSPFFREWISSEIPDTETRTLCAGAILAIITFVFSAILFNCCSIHKDVDNKSPIDYKEMLDM